MSFARQTASAPPQAKLASPATLASMERTRAPIGNQAVLRQLSRSPPRLQAKLEIGAVDDPLEREADEVADKVMRMPDPALSLSSTPPKVSRKCAACEEEDGKLQRKPPSQVTATGNAPAIVEHALRAPGQSLSAETRAFMEPRFGESFSSVRIHTDRLAAESATAVGALAYTVGSDIVFNVGRYAPSSVQGRNLIAHELVHVLQQNSLRTPSTTGTRISRPTSKAGQPLVSRAPAPGHCGGEWTCSAIPCTQPDEAGDGTLSTSWGLDVNIDTDVATAADINTPADVGHASVTFHESNGTKYSFGFYPQPGLSPTEMVSMVNGCVAHPDTTHVSCFDYTEQYKLSQQQYSDALGYAQSYCTAPPKYAILDNNCTTFVVNVAKKAGQTPPSPKGAVGWHGKEADNPNTLKEGYIERHIPTQGLTTDTEIRDWVSTHSTSDIAALPIEERVRLLDRLLDGWVSDEDVTAFEKICSSVYTAAEQSALQAALGPREKDLVNPNQRDRVHKALFTVIDRPAPALGSAEA